jgi:Neuraminidase (sialidase)
VWLAFSLTVDAKDTAIANRSTDGGRTWKNPVVVSTPAGSADYDKTWIACDTWSASPNYGTCYTTWDDYVHADAMMLSRSTDGGKHWTLATVAAAHGLGGQPVAQPNGNVVVPFWADAGQIQSLVSTDGGKTYTGPNTISSQLDHGVVGLRTEPLPSAEVDAKGNVYVVWQDCRFRSGCLANDIVMSTSKNGTAWSTTVRIPIDAVGSSVVHFLPGIGVDRATSGSSAHLGLTYYDYPKAACSLATCKVNAAFVSSTDGGATWSSPTKILGALKLPWLPNASGRFVGDYISTSIVGGDAFTVIANATTGTCTLGQIASCHEYMVAPTIGLPITGGPHVARPGAVRATHSDHPTSLPRRVF